MRPPPKRLRIARPAPAGSRLHFSARAWRWVAPGCSWCVRSTGFCTAGACWHPFGVLGACLAVGGTGLFVVRQINRVLHRVAVNMAEGADQVASAAMHVSAASQSLAQGSSEQAASLEETSSSSEEINSMTQKNAENSKVAAVS